MGRSNVFFWGGWRLVVLSIPDIMVDWYREVELLSLEHRWVKPFTAVNYLYLLDTFSSIEAGP